MLWNIIKNTELYGCIKELLLIIPCNLFVLVIHTIRKEKMYLVWLIHIIFFGFMGTILRIATCENLNFIKIPGILFQNNDILLIPSSILASCMFDLLTKIYKEKVESDTVHFLKLRFSCVIIGYVFCTSSAILAVSKLSYNHWIKFVFCVMVIFYAFFCYLLQHISSEENPYFDDKTLLCRPNEKYSQLRHNFIYNNIKIDL